MVQCWSLATLLLTLVNVHSGSSFLFRRAEDTDSPDKVAHLRSRYWNDDIQPCIEKYCLPYVRKQRVYVQCLQAYCPAGLLAMPRDLEGPGVGDLLGSMLAGSPYCPGAPPACPPELCPAPADLSTLQDAVYSVCRAVLCPTARGNDLDQCVSQRCCGQDPESIGAGSLDPASLGAGSLDPDSLGAPGLDSESLESLTAQHSQQPAVRKRINDQLLQCMQVYCSRHPNNSSRRLQCIRHKCHRAF